ncbi:hypothetical protein BV898_18092, partial [Hypsibius exemplaris]
MKSVIPAQVMWLDTPGQNVTNFRAAVNRTANTVELRVEIPAPHDRLFFTIRATHSLILESMRPEPIVNPQLVLGCFDVAPAK